MALTARISHKSDAIIQELATKTGKTKVEIIDEALEFYRYNQRMRTLDEQYERLRSDKKASKLGAKDRQELEGTLMDGLENE